jgi:hypothetical protein
VSTEREIMHDIRLALGRIPDLVMWRNNVVGVETYDHVHGGARHHHAGLPKGSADLIGVLAGRFIALEVKTPTGRTTPEQDRWLELVRAKGGFAAVVRSAADALDAIARARKGAKE